MTPVQFQKALGRLGLNQTQAAKLFHVSDRAIRRWVAGDRAVPPVVSIILYLLLAGIVTTEDVERIKP